MNDLLMNILGITPKLPPSLKGLGHQGGADQVRPEANFGALFGELLAVEAAQVQVFVNPEPGVDVPDETLTNGLPDDGIYTQPYIGVNSSQSRRTETLDLAGIVSAGEDVGQILPCIAPEMQSVSTESDLLIQLAKINSLTKSAILESVPIADTLETAASIRTNTDVAIAEGSKTVPQVTADAHEIPVRLIPINGDSGLDEVELVACPTKLDTDLNALKVSIQLPKATDGADGSTQDSRMASDAILKLEYQGKQLLIPVALEDSEASELPMLIQSDNSRLVLKGDLKQLADARIADPHVQRITSTAQIVVHQAVLVNAPEKLLRQYLQEIENPPEVKLESPIDGSSAPAGKARSVSDTDVEARQVTADEKPRPGESRERFIPRRIDPAKLARSEELVSEDQSSHKALSTDQSQNLLKNEIADRVSMLRENSVRLHVDSNATMTVNRSAGTSEPVHFKIELPATSSKIADISSFKISLKPESLGTVRVHLVVVQDHLAAKLSVETEAAKQAVESNLGALRESLIQQGVKVEEFSVNVSGHDMSRGQSGNRRSSIARKSKDEAFSLDADSVDQSVSVVTRSSLSANLAGSLSLIA